MSAKASQTTMFADARRETSAVLSECRIYRYHLARGVSDALGTINYLMLNPSTADEVEPDPTIRKCMGFAERLGCGRIEVTNLYALRSTDPKGLWSHADPVGPDNERWIVETARKAEIVIAAWGNHGKRNRRCDYAFALLKKLGKPVHHLGPFTKEGQPNHPLMLPYSTPLMRLS